MNVKQYLRVVFTIVLSIAMITLVPSSTRASDCCGGSSQADGVTVRFHILMCVTGTADVTLQGRNIDDGNDPAGPKVIATLTQTGGQYDSETVDERLVVDEAYTLATDLTSSGMSDEIVTTHIGITVPEGYTVEIDGRPSNEINKEDTGEGSWTVVIRKEGCCGGSEPGESSEPESGSVTWGVDLGVLPNGMSAGRIMLRETELTTDSYKPSALIYSEPAGEFTGGNDFVTVTRDGNGALQSIKTKFVHVDIAETTTPVGTKIEFFKLDGSGNKTGNAYTTWQVSDTSPAMGDEKKIKFEKTVGGDATKDSYEVTYDPSVTGADYSWTTVSGGGDRKIVRTSSTTGSIRTDTVEIKDDTDTVVHKIQVKYEAFAWGEEMIEQIVDPDGEADTTTWTYYENSIEIGRYTRVKSIEYPDGSWVQYDYYYSTDVQGDLDSVNNAANLAEAMAALQPLGRLGQLKQELRAWSDVALSTNPGQNDVHSIDYDWDPLLNNDDFDSQGSIVSNQLAKEEHFVPDGGMSRNQFVRTIIERQYNHDLSWIPKNTILEKYQQFLDPANVTNTSQMIEIQILRFREDIDSNTVTPDWTVDPDTMGKPDWIKFDDGRMDDYTYEDGTYSDAGVPSAASFTATTGDARRVTVVHGVEDAAANKENDIILIANHSTKDITVYDKQGRMSLQEMHTWDGTSWTRRQWTVTRYDDQGRQTSTHFHDDTSDSTTYGTDDRVTSQTDRRGIKTDYTYDDLGRVRTVKRYADLATDIILSETRNTYDAAGRVTKVERLPDGGSWFTVSESEYDDGGRLTQTKDAEGKLAFYTYNEVEPDGDDYGAMSTGPWLNETRIYPHDKDSGAVEVTWTDNQGNAVRSWSGTFSGTTWSEVSPPSGTESLTEVRRMTTVYSEPGRVETMWTYFDLGALALNQNGTKGTNYYETKNLAYDMTDRVLRSQDTMGDITAIVYDGEYVDTTWQGTDATGATIDDPDGTGSPNNMVQVSKNYYDSDRDGTGNPLGYVTRSERLTAVSTLTSFASDSTGTDFERKYTSSGMENWSKPTVGPAVKSLVDYQGRTVESMVYKNGSTTFILDKSTSHYDDANDRPWRMTSSRVHEVNGSGGTTGNYLETTFSYDGAERQFKQENSSGGFTITEFDDRNRVKRTVVASDDNGTDVTSDDIVLMETVPTYDDVGNVLRTTTYERHHDDTTTANLLSVQASIARITYVQTWYDNAHRSTHRVNFGNVAPSTSYDDPETDTAPEPNTSDDYIVSKTTYDDAGRVDEVKDNKGYVTKFFYDDMSRQTHVVENYKSGATYWDTEPSDPKSRNSDVVRITAFTYNAASQITEQMAIDPDADGATTDNQVTKYIFSDQLTDKGAPIKSNSLLRAIIYPDSDDTVASGALQDNGEYDRIELNYHADSSLHTRKDQREDVITHYFDDAGRRVAQQVTFGGSSTSDQTIKRMTYGYDDLGRLDTVTSHNTTDGSNPPTGATGIVNQVHYHFNGLGQLTTEFQDHDSAVDETVGTGSQRVEYAYDTSVTNNKFTDSHRIQVLTYPNGRDIFYGYGGTSAPGYYFNIVDAYREGDSSSDPIILNHEFMGVGRVVKKSLMVPDGTYTTDEAINLDYTDSTGDPYDTAMDRFDRIIQQHWSHYTDVANDNVFSDHDVFKVGHGYDRNSNRLYADRSSLYGSASQVYTYDELNRLSRFKQGQINSSKNDTEAFWTLQDIDYQLDGLGNSGRNNQEFNAVNEMTVRELLDDPGNNKVVEYNFNETSDADDWETVDVGDTFTTDAGGSGNLKVTGLGGNNQTILLMGQSVGSFKSLLTMQFPNTVSSGYEAGLVFGYEDSSNYWLYILNIDTDQRSVVQVVNGSRQTPIDTSSAGSVNPGDTATLETVPLSQTLHVQNGPEFSNGLPSGRMGIFTNIANMEFDDYDAHEDRRRQDFAHGWENTAGHEITSHNSSDRLKLAEKDQDTSWLPVFLKGVRCDRFEAIFSLQASSISNHVGFVFNAQNIDDYYDIRLEFEDDAPRGFKIVNGETRVGISASRYNGNMPSSIVVGDTLWYRVTCDGTTVTVYCQESTSKPSDASWTISNRVFETTNFSITGGRIGIIATKNTCYVDDFTLKTDRDSNGSYETTEHIDDFDRDGSGAMYTDSDPIYDAAGNMTYDGVFQYTYDAWNRMVKVEKAFRDPTNSDALTANNTVTTMTYDGHGRRIQKAVQDSADLDGTWKYFFDDQRIIEMHDGSDNVIKQYLWGTQYIDELIQVAINEDPTDGTEDDCERTYFALQDANFNVIGLVIGNGTAATEHGLSIGELVERYEYTPYGQRMVFFSHGSNDTTLHSPRITSQRIMIGSNDSAFALCEIGHQGLPHDETTGNIDNRARVLSPKMKRFMQKDRLGYMDGMNLFQYVSANPVRYLDPSGNNPGVEAMKVVWAKGMRKEEAAGNWMSRNFMSAFTTRGIVPAGGFRYVDSTKEGTKVKNDGDYKAWLLKSVYAQFKKDKFDPCCYCSIATGSELRVNIPNPVNHKGGFTFAKDADLFHSFNKVDGVIQSSDRISISSAGGICSWNLDLPKVAIVDTYDFVFGGAPILTAAGVANGIGAALQNAGAGIPFAIKFDLSDAIGDVCPPRKGGQT